MQQSLTILLPTHNEELLLARSIRRIEKGLQPIKPNILIIENGSTDATREIAQREASRNPLIKTIVLSSAGYGIALKEGIKHTRTDLVAIFNVDYYDLAFLKAALASVDNYDIITGSKTLKGSHDKRPLWRRFITILFTLLLKHAFGYRGSDTHGLKLMRTAVAKKLAEACRDFHELFDTELMIRAERQSFRIKELPVTVAEQRTPVSSIMERIIRSPKELLLLHNALKG